MERRTMTTSRHFALPWCLALLLGCADYDGFVDPSHGLPDEVVTLPEFRRDIVPIVERRCAFGGCHSIASKQAGLVLVADSAHTTLVNRPSRLRPDEVLVRPGDAANSWLVIMVSSDADRRRGLSRMPLASGALTPNQIGTIVNWINRGAPDD
jgi:hypothetical protein